jgi:uncharacterized protein involved in exopolysaccharide biosynthesis
MTILGLLTLFLRRVRLFIILPLVLAVLAGVYVIQRPPSYAATSIVKPEGSSGSSQLAGLAAQFGVNVPTDAKALTVDTYAQLLVAPDFLRQIAQTQFPLADGQTTTLLKYYRVDTTQPLRAQLQVAAEALRSAMDIGANVPAGLLTLKTSADSPEMAEQINELLIRGLEKRTEEHRRRRAEGERKFMDSQLQEAYDVLVRAEEALKDFQVQNRVIRAPQLVVEEARLQRRVGLQQTLYMSLAQGLSQARVNEVRTGPVLSVLGSPIGTGVRNARGLGLALVASVLLGLFAAAALAIVGNYWQREGESGTPDYREFKGQLNRLFARRK